MSFNTPVSNEILSMITGKLLGDGCITKQKGRNPRFQFIHSATDKEWCFFCYKKLMNDLPLAPPHYKKVIDKRISKGFTECYQVQSRTAPLITWLESLWYQNRRKKLPFEFLEKYLNEIALAWWYQDDGHLSKDGNIPKKIILSTDNFTSNENHQLIKLLARKFCLYFRLDSQNRLLLYDQPQIYYFLRLVEPYMHPSMKRKEITLQVPHTVPKRTTIYLPSNIHLDKPTADINKQLVNLHIVKEIVMDRTKYIKFYIETIMPTRLINETKGYQVLIKEQNHPLLQLIRSQTGLTISQIVTICFKIKN